MNSNKSEMTWKLQFITKVGYGWCKQNLGWGIFTLKDKWKFSILELFSLLRSRTLTVSVRLLTSRRHVEWSYQHYTNTKHQTLCTRNYILYCYNQYSAFSSSSHGLWPTRPHGLPHPGIMQIIHSLPRLKHLYFVFSLKLFVANKAVPVHG